MSEFTSTGANLSEASNSFSFNVKDLKPASDESLGSGGASGQQPLSFSGKEPPKKEGNDGLIESSSHEEKEIHEQPAKLDSDGSVRSLKSAQRNFQAALRVQKVYRSFRTRRQLADCAVLVEQKWWKVLDLAELKRSSISFFDIGKNESALSKWSRARTKAAKVGKGLSKDEKARKLALQHWLEAIDPRHRYGHNLQFYYVKWLHCDSAQPFFYWLDIGEGKEFDLERCCRPKLHQQCIKYLGPKEREEFEMVVQNGRFMYKNSRSILDTSGSPKGTKWIFVLSTCKKLYVGQKMKGLFQHSSFLAGGATLSAGTLVVEDGFLQAVWPHSGHYLPTEENFQAFMSFLVDNDVDLTRVQKSPMEDEEESSHKKEKKKQKDNIQTEPDHGGEKEEEEEEEEEKSRASKPPKLSKLRILTKKHIIDRQKGKAKEDDSSPDGYETAEESFLSEIDFIYEKMSMFMDGEEEEEFKDAIPQETIFKRINTHRRTQSYQLGQQLSFKWTTGAGPRIGCLRDYPSMLQFQAMEHVKLSPRAAVRRMGSPGSSSLKLRRDLFRLSPLPELLSPVGSVPEFHSPLSHPSELSKEEEEEE